MVSAGSSYPVRRHPRLRDYDYTSSGFYFVTIVVQRRLPLDGSMENDAMHLTGAGKMVQESWGAVPEHYHGIDIDSFVVMPNHLHGIVVLESDADSPSSVGPATGGRPPALSLVDIIHRFKSLTTARYRHGVVDAAWSPFDRRLWQTGYFERVIRNDRELDATRRYIVGNPEAWSLDRENPEGGRPRGAGPTGPSRGGGVTHGD